METALLSDKVDDLLMASEPVKSLQKICDLLQSNVKRYTWVGFYFMDHRNHKLYLGPYTGKPTDHTVIPFGKGICGQVAVSGETYIAGDVGAEDNYIACSMDVKSEIVIPLYVKNELVAQLDIDSDTLHAFTPEDENFLLRICKKIADSLGDKLKFENFFSGDSKITAPSGSHLRD